MNQSAPSESIPPALARLLDRQQSLQAELAECTAMLRHTVEEHGARPEGDQPPAAGAPQWLASLVSGAQHGATEAEVVEALIDAVQYLLPDSAGAVSLISDAEGRAVVAAWRAGRRWSGLPGRLDREDDEGLLDSLGREPAEDSVRVVLAGLGLSVGELRLWPGTGPLGEQAAQMETIANVAGLALAGFTLKHRLRHRSVRDALTGLFNHRYLEDTLDREIHRARRNASSVGLIMLELDDFADFGVRYGADVADRVLEAAAGVLQAFFRGSDVCCRFADARFCVVMPDAELDNTESRAEALRQQLREVRFRRQGELIHGPSASIGVTAFPAHAENRDDLLAAAESAVYRAQQAGGDSVIQAERSA